MDDSYSASRGRSDVGIHAMTSPFDKLTRNTPIPTTESADK